MPQLHDDTNTLFQLASQLVNHTNRHIFLTGKAGTGKTTFLKHIREVTKKNSVVVAPTGVAAINAGGVTMHSMFQLPFAPFIPEGQSINHFNTSNILVEDKHSLFRRLRLSKDKREVIEKLELLIIDEVSMMRCDMLDAMDAILRAFRNNHKEPFGGVQVLYIGDLFQLPPVVKNEEWEVLKTYYEGPFFFQSKAVQQSPPLYIELKKIYRQAEQQFINLLNRVRNNNMDDADFEMLNNHYNPSFKPPKEEKYIVLSTHNFKADEINNNELRELQSPQKILKGIIEGDYPDHLLPTEKDLNLKAGAQVMFIKNDSGETRKFYNGKIATVKEIKADCIIVTDADDNELEVKRETWENIKYSFNREQNRIDEEELGSFTQYPFRLAWAITIHKSQGLTFERAIIDAGKAFAAGQVYVALSRCTSLEGLVLYSRIWYNSISTDPRIIAYSEQEINADELSETLTREKQHYQALQLLRIFEMDELVKLIAEFTTTIPGKKLPDINAAIMLSNELSAAIKNIGEVGVKFKPALQNLLNKTRQTGDHAELVQRLQKAVDWFAQSLATQILKPLQIHISSLAYASKVRKYLVFIKDIELAIWQHLQKIITAQYNENYLCDDIHKYDTLNPASEKEKPAKEKIIKLEKGATYKESFDLFRIGKSIADIAAMRNLAVSTIEGHLATFVKTGEIDLYDLVTKEKATVIMKLMDEDKDITGFNQVKGKLGAEYSFGEIRAVFNFRLRMEEAMLKPY